LPREVGELVVWYLWLVLPFQQRLEALVWEKEAVSYPRAATGVGADSSILLWAKSPAF
jgi:hypothetical protein